MLRWGTEKIKSTLFAERSGEITAYANCLIFVRYIKSIKLLSRPSF